MQRDEIPLITARIAALVGDHPGGAVPLSGGITNRNYKVPFGDHDYVVRVPGKDTNLLGIDRDAESRGEQARGGSAWRPRVVLMLEDPQVMVTRFVEGGGMSEDDLREPESSAQSLPPYAQGARLGARARLDLRSFEIVERYAATARSARAPPDEYDEALSARARSRGR